MPGNLYKNGNEFFSFCGILEKIAKVCEQK